MTVIVMSLGLLGCGFHLRGEPTLLPIKYPTLVLPNTGSAPFHQALKRAFDALNIEILDTKPVGSTLPQLRVVDQELTQLPLVYGPDSELRRERLQMRITFLLEEQKEKKFFLTATRDRQLYSNQHLGDNAEKVLIEQEMQADIIQQLLRTIPQLS